MTTARSPLHVLKKQADTVAKTLKQAERDKSQLTTPGRDLPIVKIGIIMDDKLITLEISWKLIRETSEAGMAEYVLKAMRESRDAVH